MFPALFRSLIILIQIMQLILPLLGGGFKKRLPRLVKEGAILAMTNWDLIEKWMGKRQWSSEMMKKILKWRGRR